jgi:hypothetical protein
LHTPSFAEKFQLQGEDWLLRRIFDL